VPALERALQSDIPLPEGITKDKIKETLDIYKADPTNKDAQFALNALSFIIDNPQTERQAKRKTKRE